MKRLAGFLILVLLGLTQQAVAEEEVVKKVVYDLTTGEIQRFETGLLSGIVAHKTYYHSKLEELDVRVVVHGRAYKFFMQDLNNTAFAFEKSLVAKKEALGKRLKTLARQYGVHFQVCLAGVKHRDLDTKAFYPFVTFVHNAAVGLIDAQNEGYAYLPLQ